MNLAVFLVALSGILYGCMGLFGTRMLDAGFSVPNMLFWRFALAALAIFPLSCRYLHSLRLGNIQKYILPALFYSGGSALYFVASTKIGTGLSMVIFYAYPVFIFLWEWKFSGKVISKLSWLSLMLVFFGLYLLNQNQEEARFDHFGILLAVISALTYAIYLLISKRQAATLNPYLVTMILCVLCSFSCLGMTLFEENFRFPQTKEVFVTGLSLGILATAAPILLMLEGLKSLSAEKAAIISVLEPVVTVLVGVLFLGESIDWTQRLGVMIVLTGALTATLQKLN